MSSGVLALLIGTALAVGALAFVLYPLFFEPRDVTRGIARPVVSTESAIVALREIEFDRATGKLSESDYNELKTTYATRALAEMRAAGAPAATPADLDPVEARVRAYRQARKECGTCGLRPEPDAIYCSTCGAYLDATCPSCHAAVTEPSAAFCSDCGFELAAGRERAVA